MAYYVSSILSICLSLLSVRWKFAGLSVHGYRIEKLGRKSVMEERYFSYCTNVFLERVITVC